MNTLNRVRKPSVRGIDRVTDAFRFGRALSLGNTSCNASTFYSFNSAIAVRCPFSGIVIHNGDSMGSPTTNRHQSVVRRAFPDGPTVSFSALSAYLPSTPRSRWGARNTAPTEEALISGRIRLLDFAPDSYLHSPNHPDNGYGYSGTKHYGPVPSAIEGWHVTEKKLTTRADGTPFPFGEEPDTFWSAHRPGSALFTIQNPPTAGSNAPYSLKFLTGTDYNNSLPPDEQSYRSTHPDNLVALRTYIDTSDGVPVEVPDSRLVADHCFGPDTFRCEGTTILRKDWESHAATRLGFPAIQDTSTPPLLTVLVGMDEGSYFASSLPGSPRTVAAAYASFMPQRIQKAINSGTPLVRQGEWYFTPSTLTPPPCRSSRDLPALDRFMQSSGFQRVVCGLPIEDATSNVHCITRIYVSKHIRLRNSTSFPIGKFPTTPIYAIGHVKHPDHRTISLYPTLMEVVRNRSLANRNSDGFVD